MQRPGALPVDKYFLFAVFLYVFTCTLVAAYLQYSRADLLTVAGYHYLRIKDSYNWDFKPPEIRHSPPHGELIILQLRWCQWHRKQKRGKGGYASS